MNSRDHILNKVGAYKIEAVERPQLPKIVPYTEDKTEAFKKSLRNAAADWAELKPGENIGKLIAELYPQARRIASSIPGIEGVDLNPEESEDAKSLDGTDVGIVKGCFGVIENGAVWISQDVRHKAIYFISEALVVLLDKNEIVENMHEAYKRPELQEDFTYGCFIAGPSKTADIEQALVIGAHGARSLTVVFV